MRLFNCHWSNYLNCALMKLAYTSDILIPATILLSSKIILAKHGKKCYRLQSKIYFCTLKSDASDIYNLYGQIRRRRQFLEIEIFYDIIGKIGILLTKINCIRYGISWEFWRNLLTRTILPHWSQCLSPHYFQCSNPILGRNFVNLVC